MKKTIIVCDVTKQPDPVLQLTLKHRRTVQVLTPEGRVDEEVAPATTTLDLSHEGAVRLLRRIIEEFAASEKTPNAIVYQMELLRYVIEKETGLTLR